MAFPPTIGFAVRAASGDLRPCWAGTGRSCGSIETSDEITAWYPPAGLHIVLLLKFGLRYIPELLFVPLLDGLVFTPQDTAPFYVLICAQSVMLGYGTACALLLHKLHIDPRLDRFRDVLWFTIVSIIWIAMRHGFDRTVLAVLLLNVSVALYVGAKFGDTNELALQFGPTDTMCSPRPALALPSVR